MNADEYARIAEVARDHWWYRTLHREVVRALPSRPRARVLDVGAGAGVTVAVLREARPDLDVSGVEPSPVGRAVAGSQGVTLEDGSFDDFGAYEGRHGALDALLTLDCLYYLHTDARLRATAERIHAHLGPSGVWIGQIAAFPSLRGRHDAWVDCARRFTGPELVRLFGPAGFDVTYRYRYQTLAPLVFLARRVVEPLVAADAPRSDVRRPNALVSAALEALVTLEDRALPGSLARIYGSSVFFVATRR